jgi:alcohol dehydrogenase class IV
MQPVVVYASVRQDAPIACVDEAALLAREAGADCVISLGGGSVLDAAKAVCVLLTEGNSSFREHLPETMGFAKDPKPLLPHVGIPTTAGTGAEVTWGAIYFDEEGRRKCGYLHLFMSPDVAILDPEFTVGLPPFVTSTTAFDAITHGIEGSTCLTASPFGDAVALEGIRLLCANLPIVLERPSDLEARLRMQIGASLTASAAVNYIGGVVHALSHTVGARFGVPHGLGNALALPLGIRFNAPAYAPEKISLIARAVGIGDPLHEASECLAEGVAHALEELRAHCGLPRTLVESGYSMGDDDIEDLAEQALLDPEAFGNPRPIGAEDFRGLFEQLWGQEGR